MTQHDDTDDQGPPGPSIISSASKTAAKSSPPSSEKPLVPVASTSFYGGSLRPNPTVRHPLQTIRSNEQSDNRPSVDSSQEMEVDADPSKTSRPAAAGIDLDDDDTNFPNSPSVEDIGPSGYGSPSSGFPNPLTMPIHGHGYLINAILGHSKHPQFQLGAAFEWPHQFNPKNLVDYTVNAAYVPWPSRSKTAAPSTTTDAVTSSASTPAGVRSYSQAVGRGSPSQATQQGQPPSASETGSSQLQPPSGSENAANSLQESSKSRKAFGNAILEASRPHPNAYYNIATQAWTIIAPMPTEIVEGQTLSTDLRICKGVHATKKTHHYVRIPNAIDPKFILRPSEVEIVRQNSLFDKRPEEKSLFDLDTQFAQEYGGPSSVPLPAPMAGTDPSWITPPTPYQLWWDLYICSGCRHSFTVSPPDYIPSVWGQNTWQQYIRERLEEEKAKGGEFDRNAVILAVQDYIWKVLRNLLYLNNTSRIPMEGVTFVKRMGKSLRAVDLFKRLHFSLNKLDNGKDCLEPPLMTPNVVLLLSRAYLELSIWAAQSGGTPNGERREIADLIHLKSFENTLEETTGPDNVGVYSPSPNDFINTQGFSIHYKVLGVTPETADEDIVFAYERQIESDPVHLPYYLDALKEIASLRGDSYEAIQLLLATENSRHRYGQTEINTALVRLGIDPVIIPHQHFFDLKIYQLPSEDEIASAYHDSKTRIAETQGTESDMKELKDAVAMLAKVLSSDLLAVVLDSTTPGKPSVGPMTLEESYTYLQVDSSLLDDVMCSAASIMFFDEDSTSDFQKEKARVALGVIADARNSQGIRIFLNTGVVPETIEAPREAAISVDRPAGLQNIGNTCYLNSLLQYFFTIKELRDVVLDFDQYQETRPFSEIAETKRVGGRTLTEREIERSKKFTKLLSTLFHSLIQDKVASVRPERDLAYLALVSSRDEDASSQPPQDKEGSTSETKPAESMVEGEMKVDGEVSATKASAPTVNTSDEGLAAPQTPQAASTEAEVGSPSVLGKRSSDHFDEDLGRMDVDTRLPEVATSPEAINSDLQEGTTPASAEDKGDMIAQPAEDGVIEIVPSSEARQSTATQAIDTSSSQKREPPPLPPRTPSITETNMMFGRQNDVSEAMDNVIFQIESALDDSKIPKKSVPTLSGKPCSFIQGLFYGTSRQVLEFEAEPESTRIKEEPFCYQLVDVAKDGNDLYDGLDAAFQPSILEIEGKKVKRQDILTQLPPILQIQLQRVQFDRATSRVYKSNAYMPFPQTLRMGRYLATDERSPDFATKSARSIELRTELTKLQATLARLEQKDENQQTLPDILTIAADSLKQLTQSEEGSVDEFFADLRRSLGDPDADVLTLLAHHASDIDNNILQAKQRLDACRREMEELWADDHENAYELSSVFIHLGAAGYGHYYLYQRALPNQPDRWLKFNDESVTDVDVSEVFADTTGKTANPYWLTYVRKSEIPQRIDAVCRHFDS